MSLAFCVLASSSSGNCTAVVCAQPAGRHVILIDAGLSPRGTRLRLEPLGLSLQNVAGIVLTHLDHDHFNHAWLKVIDKLGIAVHVHRRHRNAAWRCGLTARHVRLFDDGVQSNAGPRITAHLCAHDALGSASFVIEHAGLRLGYATDLGRVPDSLIDFLSDVNALAIESNYDRQMQIGSGRPFFLQRRIMGGAGHLSNDQTLEAVGEIACRSPLSHVALLHLSRQCNCPELVRSLYRQRLPEVCERLTIGHHRRPSPMLHVHRLIHAAQGTVSMRQSRLRQLALFDLTG